MQLWKNRELPKIYGLDVFEQQPRFPTFMVYTDTQQTWDDKLKNLVPVFRFTEFY
jgi:hypothetical protein